MNIFFKIQQVFFLGAKPRIRGAPAFRSVAQPRLRHMLTQRLNNSGGDSPHNSRDVSSSRSATDIRDDGETFDA